MGVNWGSPDNGVSLSCSNATIAMTGMLEVGTPKYQKVDNNPRFGGVSASLGPSD